MYLEETENMHASTFVTAKRGWEKDEPRESYLASLAEDYDEVLEEYEPRRAITGFPAEACDEVLELQGYIANWYSLLQRDDNDSATRVIAHDVCDGWAL